MSQTAFIVVGNVNAVGRADDASIVGIFMDRLAAEDAATKHAQWNDPTLFAGDIDGYIITEIPIDVMLTHDAVHGSLKVRDLVEG